MEKKLFEEALGVQKPLEIEYVEFDKGKGELHIYIIFARGSKFSCSSCSEEGLSVYDTKERTWRHLNFFQYKCYIHMAVPRLECPKCGIKTWEVPWSRPQSGFTLLFEMMVMIMVRDIAVSILADQLKENDTRLWRIVKHYTQEAYAKKIYDDVTRVGVDETSSRKRHNYVTIFANLDNKEVIYATEGKDSKTFKRFIEEFGKHEARKEQIQEITMDMSPAFIAGANEHLPQANVTYDKFHVIQLINKAVDEVRRREARDNPLLKRTRYIWLKNPGNLTTKQEKTLDSLKNLNIKTAKSYQMKLTFQNIYASCGGIEEARKEIRKWLNWADRSRIEEMRAVSRTIKQHLEGIIRYFKSRLTTGAMEGINSRVQEIKRRAKGFRNIDNFIIMIYLEAAGLVILTHTK